MGSQIMYVYVVIAEDPTAKSAREVVRCVDTHIERAKHRYNEVVQEYLNRGVALVQVEDQALAVKVRLTEDEVVILSREWLSPPSRVRVSLLRRVLWQKTNRPCLRK